MIENVLPLKIPPGVFRNGTEYQALGRWYDSNLMRWEKGSMGPIGGWKPVLNTSGLGVNVGVGARGAHAWVNNGLVAQFAVGTHQKLWSYPAGVLTDITPAGFTTGRSDGYVTVGSSKTYGSGLYSAGPYSRGPGVQYFVDADTWQIDNLDDSIYAVFTADGKLYKSTGAAQATAVTNAPTSNRGVVITPDRFIFVLGAGGNPRKVQWPQRENDTVWLASDNNDAGEVILQTESNIMGGVRMRRGTLILTRADAHFASYIGGVFIHSFDPVGRNCGMTSPHAAVVVDDVAYWMGDRQFYAYAGSIEPVVCDVGDFVFDNLNTQQRAKVFAVEIPNVSTIRWHYPSLGSAECDRYVEYNYVEKHWAIGALDRVSGFGAGVWESPILIKPTGDVMEHETGTNFDGQVPFAVSGPVELDDGNHVMTVNYVIPDETAAGSVEVTFFVKTQPEDTERTFGPYKLSKLTPVRWKARQARVKVSEVRNTVLLAFGNVGFEDGGSSPLSSDSRWKRWTPGGDDPAWPSTLYTYELTSPIGGRRSLKLPINQNGTQGPMLLTNVDTLGAQVSVPIAAGDEVRLTASGSSTGTGDGVVYITYYDSLGLPVGISTLVDFQGVVSTKSASSVAPTTAAAMRLYVRATGIGNVLIDDIKVERVIAKKWRLGVFKLGAILGGKR